jgi:hypothetical protein
LSAWPGVGDRWDDGRVNQGWFAVLGALAAGVPQLVTATVQNLSARGQRKHEAAEAQAKREADAAEAEAQRSHQARAAERAECADKIREWREGLDAAHTEYRSWYAKRNAQGPKPVSANYTPEPNIVGAAWFQSLRPHLLETDRLRSYRTHDDIQCDDDAADVLSEEIGRIERVWVGE